jgi:flagellar biosynthesis/type III secretory pathway protein FliH
MENANDALENSIRAEAARIITESGEKEALEIKQLDEACEDEMNNFQKQTQAKTDARLKQELSILENKAILERRKFKLQSTEKFINSIVDELMKGIRDNTLYRKFLIDSVRNIVKQIPAGVEVRLKPEDLCLEKEITTAIGDVGRNQSVVVKGDPNILWGGCLVWDQSQKRIFNNTIERIYFRKSLLIRQKVMKILTEQSRGGQETVAK